MASLDSSGITYVLIIQSISMLFVLFPTGSLLVWQRLRRKWKTQGARLSLGKRMRAERKLKKYWEIRIPKS